MMISHKHHAETERKFQEIFTRENLENLIDFRTLKHWYPMREYSDVPRLIEASVLRTMLIDKYLIFGFPVKEAVQELSKFIDGRPVHEIGAGTGYLSYALNKVNPDLDIKAYDSFVTRYGDKDGIGRSAIGYQLWRSIECLDALSIVPTIKDSVIIVCWPDYGSKLIAQVSRLMHPSNDLVYIGEPEAAATASDTFFEENKLCMICPSWFTWLGTHDAVYVKIKND